MVAPRHRGRFAPSPTGKLHLGNARTALLGWLWARSEGGQFLLRIEDLDSARCRQEHVDDLLLDLDYLGLTFDGAPLLQSQRRERYEAALEALAARGRIYPCICTRAEIARAALAPHGPSDDGPPYPGTCRRRPGADAAWPGGARERPAALRFRVKAGRTSFVDELKGPLSQDVEAEVGDFVVRRNDDVASYQLAVVVDDHETGVTHVLRGDDLVSSTPRQLQLYEALGWPPPRFAHVGLVVDPDRRRLAKREGATRVKDLRLRGVPPERVVGLLALWSGLSDGAPVRPEALIHRFDLARLPPGPVVADAAAIEKGLGVTTA